MEKLFFNEKKTFLNSVGAELQKVGGVSFVGVRNYLAQSGELSNFLINVGVNYENVKRFNLDWLMNIDPETIINDDACRKYDVSASDIREAVIALREAAINPSQRRSRGQREAFEYLATGFKYGVNTLDFYVSGIRLRKSVIVPADTSINLGARPLTRAKNYIRWTYLKKYRTYKLDEGTSIVLNQKEFMYNADPETSTTVDEFVSFFEVEEAIKKASNEELIRMSK